LDSEIVVDNFEKTEFDEKQFGGMTVNERLFSIGKLNEFDDFCIKKKYNKILKLLLSVGLEKSDIELFLNDLRNDTLPTFGPGDLLPEFRGHNNK
jgi:hypothetical protein